VIPCKFNLVIIDIGPSWC